MEQTPIGTAAQTLEELRACYASFLEALTQRSAVDVGEAFAFFISPYGNPRLSQTMDEFAPAVAGLAEGLAAQLTGCPPEDADALAVQALEQMLFYPMPRDAMLEFSLAALEGSAQPLLSFLAAQRRQELAERYAKRTKPRKMLPNQKKIWKALSRG